MKTTVMLIALLALAGCATIPSTPARVLVNDNPEANYDTDVFECRNQATAYAANMGMAANGYMIQIQTNKCLKVRGWRYERA